MTMSTAFIVGVLAGFLTALFVLARARVTHDGELFESAFRYSRIGMALVAPDGTFLRVNPAFCELTGYEAEELTRRRFQDITHPDDLERDIAGVNRMLAGEIDTYTVRKRYVRKDGVEVWVELSVSATYRGEGRVLEFFVSQVRDLSREMTRVEELEAERDRLREEWHALNETVRIVSRGAIHPIRERLAAKN